MFVGIDALQLMKIPVPNVGCQVSGGSFLNMPMLSLVNGINGYIFGGAAWHIVLWGISTCGRIECKLCPIARFVGILSSVRSEKWIVWVKSGS